MRIKKFLKRIFIGILVLGICIFAVIAYANWKIPEATKGYVFDNIEDVPEIGVGLVLGTSPCIGTIVNPYYAYRIQAAKELYEAGKINHFVLSGDNRHASYNEPKYMRKSLINVGIPDSIIHLDYAGFRTFDSVIRAKEVFQQDSFIVISQKFHNERAIFIARHYNINAYGYNATDIKLNRSSFKTKLREKLARVKVFIDILFDKEPKFLGDPIDIYAKKN